MAEQEKQEPRGLGEHTRGKSSQRAHDMGWQLNEEERKSEPGNSGTGEKPAFYGGKDFDYGARDFGDTAENTEGATDAKAEERVRDYLEEAPEEKKAS